MMPGLSSDPVQLSRDKGSLLDPAEAAGMDVAGLACVKRALINSQPYEGKESKCPNVPAHSGNIKEQSEACCCHQHSFYQRQKRRWHKEIWRNFLVVSVLDFFQADFAA